MRFASTVRIATLAGVLASSQIAMAAEAPTYTKDIAPIMFRSCVSCHRPGEIAPMSLLSYDAVRPWAKAIKRRVVSREMPPWFADKEHSVKFRNDISLSESEIDLISRWVDAGAAKGSDADMPAAPKFAQGWSHPKGLDPDYVIEMPAEFKIPAEGEVPNISFFDISGIWNVNKALSVRAGINNVLDKDPPVVASNYSGTGSGNVFPNYDTLGREVFFGATLKF